MDELTAWLILLRAPALGAAQLSCLLDYFGNALDVLGAAGPNYREAGIELATRTVEYLADAQPNLVHDDRAWLDKPGHQLVTLQSPHYPALLAQLADAPLGLFIKGNAQLLSMPQLAVVGSRNPTPYGRELAESMAKHLTQCGLVITSGLAIGIDAAGHRGALAGTGHTVAVCGTGLDIVYPRSSETLAQEIAERGVLVSEFPPGTPPRKANFPQRNRIISGVSLGTLVVEAALHSGSLITARLAGDQGREVFAIPGSVHNPMAKGCHQLIRQGAKLVDSAEDILVELGPLAAVAQRQPIGSNNANYHDLPTVYESTLDKESKILLDALGFEPRDVDQLVVRSGLKADAVTSMLLVLELEGRIASYPGGLYVRTGPAL